MKPKYKDFPFEEVSAKAKELADAGWLVHQKFTCQNCGSRQTMPDPNVFYRSGGCEECGAETDIESRGCNYVLISRPI